MQTPSLRNGKIYMKDAHCAEKNETSIFRFLFFELWLIIYNFWWHTSISKCVTDRKYKFPSKVVKLTWKMRNVLKRMKNQFTDFCVLYFLSYGHNSQNSVKKLWFLSSQKMCNVLKRFLWIPATILRFLVFDIWSILYWRFRVHWRIH